MVLNRVIADYKVKRFMKDEGLASYRKHRSTFFYKKKQKKEREKVKYQRNQLLYS